MFASFISFFGMLSVYRITEHIRSALRIGIHGQSTLLCVASGGLGIVVSRMISGNPVLLFFFWASIVLLSFIAGILIRVHLETRFYRSIPQTLDLILLEMKMGSTFRGAYLSVVQQESNTIMRRRLQIVWDRILIQSPTPLSGVSRFFNSFDLEMRAIDQQTHKSMQRLKSYRDQLNRELYFRRRSGQAVRQARAQAAILAILYVGLFCFVVIRNGYHNLGPLLAVSFALFTLGCSLILLLGRTRKWKV